jgi:2-octaprenyl-6-methoxyphenol hydroxylase
VHPLAGQGLNLGLDDTRELADLVIGAMANGQDIGSVDVLSSFHRKRLLENQIMAGTIDQMNRCFMISNPFFTSVRGAAINSIDRMGPLKVRSTYTP